MRRGELYLVTTGRADPRRQRVFVVVSRNAFLQSSYSTAVCVPVYTTASGISTEVQLDPTHGLKHTSVLRCDEVQSIPRTALRNYVGSLPPSKMREANVALAAALALEHD